MSVTARKAIVRICVALGVPMLVSGCAERLPQWQFGARPVFRIAGAPGESVADPSLAWTSGGRLYVGVSTSIGASSAFALFSTSGDGDHLVKNGVAPVRPSLVTGGQSGPIYVLDRDEHEHILWSDEASGTHHLYAMQRGWADPAWVLADVRDKSASAKKWIAFGGLSTGPHDTVYASFLDERGNKTPAEDVSSVWFARSANGRAFSPNIQIAAHTCSCCRTATAAAPDGKTVYVAFRGNYDTDVRDMAVATSYDGGRTFGKPVRLGPDGWQIHGCPEAGPSLLVQGDRLYVVWFTLGAESRPTIRLAISDDFGRSFSRAKIISGGILDVNHPKIAALTHDSEVVVFEGTDPSRLAGNGNRQAWAETITGTTPGVPAAATPPEVSIHDPVVAAANAQLIYVAAVAGDDVIIMRGRARTP